jgi:SAM-dependent methyltransferase
MKQPHDNWGEYYDYVYEQTFGGYYNALTADTLQVIKQILPDGSIIDFGAGTGRLAIPLAEQGYKVVAVEKSAGMVNEFKRKLSRGKAEIEIHNCSISEYDGSNADLAIALFTVLSYSFSEEELTKNLQAICKSVRTGGYFFFDLPSTLFFQVGRIIQKESANLNRIVDIGATEQLDIYTYHERCSGVFDGKEFSYEDEFKIRYWELSAVEQILNENGFIDTKQTFPQFNSTGSTYKLFMKL